MLVAHGLHCTHHRPLSSCARCKMDELCGSKSTHNSSSCCQELLLEHQTASSAGVVVELLSGSAIVIARRAGVNRPTASTSTGRDAGGAASPAAGEGGPAILDAEVRRHSFRVHGPTIRPIRSPRGAAAGVRTRSGNQSGQDAGNHPGLRHRGGGSGRNSGSRCLAALGADRPRMPEGCRHGQSVTARVFPMVIALAGMSGRHPDRRTARTWGPASRSSAAAGSVRSPSDESR